MFFMAKLGLDSGLWSPNCYYQVPHSFDVTFEVSGKVRHWAVHTCARDSAAGTELKVCRKLSTQSWKVPSVLHPRFCE